MINLTILNHWYIPWISHPSAMVTMALWHPRLWRPEPGRCARRSGGLGVDGDHQRSGEGLGQAAPWMIHDDPLEELRMLVGQVGEQWHHDNLDSWWFILMVRHFLYVHLCFMLISVTLNVGFQVSLQQKKQTRRRARKAGNCVVQLSCSRVWYLISPSKSSVGLFAHFSSSVSTWDDCIWVMGVAGMCRAWCILNWLVISKPQGGAPPSYKWVIIPLTMDIWPINHSCWTYTPT